jgi:hypothetical protein
VHFVDPVNAEIIMEFVEGNNVKDAISPELCYHMGRYYCSRQSFSSLYGRVCNYCWEEKSRQYLGKRKRNRAARQVRTGDLIAGLDLCEPSTVRSVLFFHPTASLSTLSRSTSSRFNQTRLKRLQGRRRKAPLRCLAGQS